MDPLQPDNPCLAVDPCDADCPSRDLLDIVGDRWSMLVMMIVGQGVRRNGELKRRIGGISQKMLTQTLRTLEANGLISRHDFQMVPPRVEYELTALGWSLAQVIDQLGGWVQANYAAVAAAQAAFQERATA